MKQTALGVSVFERKDKLVNLLDSIDADLIKTVYIADTGKKYEYTFHNNYEFDINVLDLEYDSGLGFARHMIVSESTEPFLLIVDADMEVPSNVDILYEQLTRLPSVGGISGILWEDTRIRSGCHDLFEEKTLLNRSVLIRGIREQKDIYQIFNHPVAEFESITNAALFRRECLDDYSWDPNIKIKDEHTDFYIGHKKTTDWEFAVSPDVIFKHDSGGSEQYESERYDTDKLQRNEEYFLNKWNYQMLRWGDTSSWINTAYNKETIRSNLISRLPDRIENSVRIYYNLINKIA